MSDASSQFCPRCGDPVPDREDPLPGEPRDRNARLCDACYFDDFEMVDAPDRIEVAVCSGCGAVHRGNRWVDVGARDYTDVAIESVTEALGVHVGAADVTWAVDPEQVDENTIRMHCQFTGVIRGTPVEEAVVVPVKISRGTCDRCGRVAGGYYASVVQVRAADRTPTPEERRRAIEIAETHVADKEDDGDREAFVSEVKETPDGPDLKLSTNRLGEEVARRITRELGGDFESYPTLVTEDSDGNEVYRVTYAVRLPTFTAGDVVDPADGDGPVLVRSVRGNLKGVRLASGADYEAPFEGIDATRLATREDAVETTVVTVEDDHAVQVLDPETYEATTVPRPDFLDSDAATTPAVKTRAGLYLLPE
jgi:nonsense-mediated mRNA decay protein 3